MAGIPKQYQAAVYDEPGKLSTKIEMLDMPEPGPGEGNASSASQGGEQELTEDDHSSTDPSVSLAPQSSLRVGSARATTKTMIAHSMWRQNPSSIRVYPSHEAC